MEATTTTSTTELGTVQIGNEHFFKISNSDSLRPFFMSIVSDSNHWMFISSNGGLSAGRKNPGYALFPYYTDDKITESSEITGSKSIFTIRKSGQSHIWEPFSYRFDGQYRISRNLYKNVFGNKILFEEENHDLHLTFRYQWNSSELFGFVKRSELINHSDEDVAITLLDGIQNILPNGVNSDLQNSASNLVDAYKRSELQKDSGIGIYSLSAIIVDKAEPSEALKANIVWSLGLDNPTYLLSSLQLKDFRKEKNIQEELDVKAEKGAYFIHADVLLKSKSTKEWLIVADVNKNHANIAKLSQVISSDKQLKQKVNDDIDLGTQRLIALNAAADGMQLTSDNLRDTRHFSNVLFNIMRGGIFDHNYEIERWFFCDYLSKANKVLFENSSSIIDELPDVFSLANLKEIANRSDSNDFKRLCFEYMPLKFSRRHGDPSRPWNKFSINTRNESDGSKILDYEGNWRDIFQNWEALAHSYPEFVESMIHKFLNATTFDGYNPYRITKGGFDWETIEPDDPWSYIGYWGDHQIIYLLKFLEIIENHQPGRLNQLFDEEVFAYANVPYKIKSYSDILKNPKDTIDFDHALDHKIRQEREEIGADAALMKDENQSIYTVNFIEKILATVLAKISNFSPEGGIWMNTQRPEWNDANNALVGNGVSMVTLCYLRRFLHFFNSLLDHSDAERFKVSNELIVFYKSVVKVFEDNQDLLSRKISDKERKSMLDGLGQAGSDYREHIYKRTFWGNKRTISLISLKNFVNLSLRFADHTIQANKRSDHLYHAYNLMTIENDSEVSISYLSEMLEGQVAVLSSGYLSSEEALLVLDALKNSALFRKDQYSYILYPNKDLPRFTNKNTVPADAVKQSALLTQLESDGNLAIIEKDINGAYHFNGNFKNANDLQAALDELATSTYARDFVEENRANVLDVFEEVFNHKAFTGRSGTFFGYEGLGSIYWHMVSKLLLAVQECCLKAFKDKASEEVKGRLLEHYYEINEGIGVHKPPSLYGAFPTDPYSHTPAGKGAQQPGMTGQVKEDILCRFGELGVFVQDAKLYFNPCLLRKTEFLNEPKVFYYVDVHSNHKQLPLEADSLCFTYCQVPVVYKLATENSLEILDKNNIATKSNNLQLDANTSRQIFERSGKIVQLTVYLKGTLLR
jgi:predicted nucleotidyltransferase